MEPHEEGFNYRELWKRICEEAEYAIQEQRWQASWLGQNFRLLFDPNETHAQERRAGKSLIRRWAQTTDLARCINEGDTGRYIRRWYSAPSPNGITFSYRCTSEDEYEALQFGVIRDQEGHNGPGPTATYQDEADLFDGINEDGSVRWKPARPYDQAADGRAADAFVGRAHQEGTEVVYYLSTWDAGEDRVGLWSRVRQSWHQVWDKLIHRHHR